jgi:hypothetical protein
MGVAVFLESEEAVDTAKKMIDLAGDNVKILAPLNEDGTVNEDDATMSKEEAKGYVEKYDGEVGGVCQRCLDLYEEGADGRSMWIETYKRVVGSYDAVDILSWG